MMLLFQTFVIVPDFLYGTCDQTWRSTRGSRAGLEVQLGANAWAPLALRMGLACFHEKG